MWIKDLAKIQTLREKKIVVNLSDLGFGNNFLNVTPKAQATKGKNR